jgi:hypothetical protein
LSLPALARRSLLAAAAAGLFGLGLGSPEDLPGREWTLVTPVPVAQVTTATNPAWAELDCARCHEAITREWAQTRHGQAWNNEVFQAELEEIIKKPKCTSCHAPEPLLVEGLERSPRTRASDLHFGVDCNTCHLGADGAMHGPFGAETEAHASTRNELFTTRGSSELCLSCHSRSVGPVIGIGRDFDDEELAERGYSCVGCHMAEVEREVATAPEGGAPLAARPGRSHHLQTPRDPGFLRLAFQLRARRGEAGVILAVSNRAGHRIPGLNDRMLLFRVEALGAGGEVLAEDSLAISRSASIGVGETLELSLVAAGAVALRVTGTHTAKSLEREVEFCAEIVWTP